MAIVTFSRQLASFGDDVSSLVAQKLGYNYISRQILEEKIVALGFPKEKLHKYDEKMPGFLLRLQKTAMNILIICRQPF